MRYQNAPFARLLKRGLDLSVAAAGLLLCAPLLLVIALAIRRDTPGPVLFRQVREGYRRRDFTILKFRTMSDRRHSVFEQARRNDPRVTRVGAYLRAASFDVPPGLTGLAQVSGLRGETETLEKMAERIKCDRIYVKTGSFFGDIAICIKTVFIPLGHDHAY